MRRHPGATSVLRSPAARAASRSPTPAAPPTPRATTEYKLNDPATGDWLKRAYSVWPQVACFGPRLRLCLLLRQLQRTRNTLAQQVVGIPAATQAGVGNLPFRG